MGYYKWNFRGPDVSLGGGEGFQGFTDLSLRGEGGKRISGEQIWGGGGGGDLAMGQNPNQNRNSSEHANPTTKIPTKMGGAPTPKWDTIGFDPQPSQSRGGGRGGKGSQGEQIAGGGKGGSEG